MFSHTCIYSSIFPYFFTYCPALGLLMLIVRPHRFLRMCTFGNNESHVSLLVNKFGSRAILKTDTHSTKIKRASGQRYAVMS